MTSPIPDRLRHLAFTFSIIILQLTAAAVASAAITPAYFSSVSRLSTGKWVKIKITETGMHQISDAELTAMGFSDPKKVAICGYPAVSLSDYRLTSQTPDDVPVLPSIRHNGKLIFYGEGAVRLRIGQNHSGGTYPTEVIRNNYAGYGAYFLTDALAPAAPAEIPVGSATHSSAGVSSTSADSNTATACPASSREATPISPFRAHFRCNSQAPSPSRHPRAQPPICRFKPPHRSTSCIPE